MKQIDTRGLSCPQPVILVINEIKNSKENFEILLDSTASCENVKRVLKKNNLNFEINEKQDHTIYAIIR